MTLGINNSRIDTTEAQLLIIAVEIITYIGGVDVWRIMVSVMAWLAW